MKTSLKIAMILIIPFIFGYGFVTYTKSVNKNSEKETITFRIKIPKENCGTIECEKECLKRGYNYEGTRATGTNHFGSKKYQCFCVK
jgi:hypothetical protein